MKTVTDQVRLPWPTTSMSRGPRLSSEDDRLKLEYDFEDGDGSRRITAIVFKEVLAYQYRQASSSDAEDVTLQDGLVRMTESPWLDETRRRWNEYVGWQENEKRRGGAARFCHFHIYFDDWASVDVIASSYLVSAA